MKSLIKNIENATGNIISFNQTLASFATIRDIDTKTLIDNIPNVRAWYAYKDGEGNNYFGPSKYIGYEDIDANYYCDHRGELDGRMTEKVLSQWYEEISIKHPLYKELSSDLTTFCEKYEKKPNSLFRINIPLIKSTKDSLEEDVVELVWKVFLGLNKENKELLTSKIRKHKFKE